MDIKYFKLLDDIKVKLPDNILVTIKRDTIFHILSRYRSPITGEEMIVITIDKCTPIAVDINTGVVLD